MRRLNKNFYPLGSDLSVKEIKTLFRNHFNIVNRQYLIGIKIINIEIIRSRVWGKPKLDSDLDILVYYEDEVNPQDMKSLFAMSNNRLDLGNFEADVTFTKDPIEKWISDSFYNLKPNNNAPYQ